MERIALRIREDALDRVLDRLLPLVPGGVHETDDGDGVIELAAYDEPGRLPALDVVEACAGDALIGAVDRVDVPVDWRERRRLYGRGATVGSVHVRSEFDRDPDDPEGVVDVVLRAREGAFGAGAHATTQMLLLLMDELTPSGGFADLGCGAGTLAIAAAKLGWSPVVALDNREPSIEATRDNVAFNDVEVELAQVDLATEPAPALDTLAANIPPAVHRNIAATLDPTVRNVLISGLAAADAQVTIDRYVEAGLRLAAELESDNWVAARLERLDG